MSFKASRRDIYSFLETYIRYHGKLTTISSSIVTVTELHSKLQTFEETISKLQITNRHLMTEKLTFEKVIFELKCEVDTKATEYELQLIENDQLKIQILNEKQQRSSRDVTGSHEIRRSSQSHSEKSVISDEEVEKLRSDNVILKRQLEEAIQKGTDNSALAAEKLTVTYQNGEILQLRGVIEELRRKNTITEKQRTKCKSNML